MKERALKAVTSPKIKTHKFSPDDKLLRSLDSLGCAKLHPTNSAYFQARSPIAAHNCEVDITTPASGN